MRSVEQPRRSGRWPRLLKARWLPVLIVRGLGMGALFGFEIVLASSLGVDGYGAFSFLLAIAVIVSRVASLGWFNQITRLISANLSAARLALVRGALTAAHLATLLGLVAATAVLTVASLGFGLLSIREIYLTIVPLAVLLTFLELHRFALRGLDAGDVGEFLLVLLLPTAAAAAIWSLSIREVGAAINAYCTVVAASLLLSTFLLVRRLPAQLWSCKAEFQGRQWTLAAFAMLIGGASDEISARIAVLVLGGLGNDAEAGLYQAAARLSLMALFFLRVLTPVAAPQIAVLYRAGKWEELRSMYRRLCALSVIGSLPFVLLFWVLPELVLGLFGAEFREAAPVLRILSIGYVAAAAAGPCATALMMIGQERIYSYLACVAVLVNGLGCYFLALNYGAIGAASATAVVITINNLLYAVVFFRATSPARRALAPADVAAGG